MSLETKRENSRVEQGLRLERKFAQTIKSILGNQFIVQDPIEDTLGGTDFVIWNLIPIRIAVRLRTFGYLRAFGGQFTIRWALPSGAATEIHKIRKGLVDYLLYGFVDMKEERLEQYFIGNLAIFRQANLKPIGIFKNDPPDSQLAVFALSQLPAEFVVKFWKRG